MFSLHIFQGEIESRISYIQLLLYQFLNCPLYHVCLDNLDHCFPCPSPGTAHSLVVLHIISSHCTWFIHGETRSVHKIIDEIRGRNLT